MRPFCFLVLAKTDIPVVVASISVIEESSLAEKAPSYFEPDC
jgi:hypothetical protein